MRFLGPKTDEVQSAASAVSLDERYNVASATHASAITIFVDVAGQLDDAAEQYDAIVREAQEEITRLTYIRDEAITSAAAARKSSGHVLELTRGIPT
jgi:capsular polysaccharide biosynthesis protein